MRNVLAVLLPIAALLLSSFTSFSTRVTTTVLPSTDLSTSPPASSSSTVGIQLLTIERRDTLRSR